MKFCKDCKHYNEGAVSSKVYIPDMCKAGEKVFDPVSGREIGYAGEPRELRHDENKCGMSAKWFDPANLDGRLAILEDK